MLNRRRGGFTLVEILIVVVILGILAAIVIPQFTNASQDAQAGNVRTQLQTLRNQVELFRTRNNGSNPVLAGANGASFSDFTVLTNSFGRTQDRYLRSPAVNPRNGRSEVVTTTATGAAFITEAAAAATPTGPGWRYNVTTGEFAAQGWDETNSAWTP